ncbi:hypothetical protein [Aliamphritea ceti]|uniref:hypothetical protein n=1 Tax=Aliamphritea ceti TaxID=1524258 RepID=UPI0021C25C6D|nr:hypothetical protein [Aliamphritea ceti]
MQQDDNTEINVVEAVDGVAVEPQTITVDVTESDSNDADVLNSLDAVEVEADSVSVTMTAEGTAAAPAELTDVEKQIAAQLTAAAATGGISTVIEKVFKPAEISDEQRKEFMEALTPVLMKSGGVMPPWLAKILADWKEELELAKKTVCIGWAVYDQVQEDRKSRIQVQEA